MQILILLRSVKKKGALRANGKDSQLISILNYHLSWDFIFKKFLLRNYLRSMNSLLKVLHLILYVFNRVPGLLRYCLLIPGYLPFPTNSKETPVLPKFLFSQWIFPKH